MELVSSLFGPIVDQGAAVDEEMDVLGDVGGVVADALDVLGAEQQMGAEADVARVFHHVGQQLAEQRVVHRVDLLVGAPYGERLVGLTLGVGVEHVLELAQRELACA